MPNDYNLKENPIAFLIQGLAHANPEYRAMRERRSRDREQQKFALKKQKLLEEAQERLWKKQATAQADKEEQGRRREKKAAAEKKEAMMVGLNLARGRAQQMGPGPVNLLSGVTGTDMRPLTIDAPGAGAQNINAQRIMDLVQGGASLSGATSTAKALGSQKKEPTYQIKQNEKGEFVLIPTSPGARPSRTGVMGPVKEGASAEDKAFKASERKRKLTKAKDDAAYRDIDKAVAFLRTSGTGSDSLLVRIAAIQNGQAPPSVDVLQELSAALAKRPGMAKRVNKAWKHLYGKTLIAPPPVGAATGELNAAESAALDEFLKK